MESRANTTAQAESLWNVGFDTIKELESDLGILASGKEEIFGCIFGRDSLITSLKLIKVYERTGNAYFLTLVRKVLQNLAMLQGKEINIESGEEPGKCIHEYRPSNHEHLTKRLETPWYVYPDNVMRNYDSVDATPLFLIACSRYYQASADDAFVAEIMPNIKAGLNWINEYGDKNGDGFIDYRLHPERTHGGLTTQSWMDSAESVFHEDGTPVAYPIAPVEAQSYTFLALRLWSNYFGSRNSPLSKDLFDRATLLKEQFNYFFTQKDENGTFLASGIDGNGKPMTSVRSSMGHCLWASLEADKDGITESIVDDLHVPAIIERMMQGDLFAPNAGIRTLSTRSSAYAPNSYHNGSIWPHDTSIIAEGFEIFGFFDQSEQIRQALLLAITHFNTPIELFVYNEDRYEEYRSSEGQEACKKQAWSAASLMKDVAKFTSFAVAHS